MAERPVRQSRLRFGPGERAELLVDMQTDQAIRSVSYPDSVTGRKMGPSMMMGGMTGNTEMLPIIELRAAKLETADLSLPERLIRVPSWSLAQVARTRTFTLDMAMMGMTGGGSMDGSIRINGRSMDNNRRRASAVRQHRNLGD
jgi:FtsP/CotA-like multicopper oxidase with cupredoxin domain